MTPTSRAELLRRLQAKAVEYSLLSTPAGGWALMVPRLAARVLGAGLGERNAFWVSPGLEACLEGRDWNAGGQRTWLAPELGPRGFFGATEGSSAVPPALDPGAYRLEEARPSGASCQGGCRLTSADGTEYSLEIERRVELVDASGHAPGQGILLRIRHCLRNAGPRPIASSVGLWSILQLPCLPEGNLFLPDAPYRQRFGELPAGWVSRRQDLLALRTAPACRWKVGQPPSGPEAAISHRRPAASGPDGQGEVHVIVRCAVSPAGLYADGGDVLQAYNSPFSGSQAFCELECHAPAATLEPGQADGQDVEIEIRHEA